MTHLIRFFTTCYRADSIRLVIPNVVVVGAPWVNYTMDGDFSLKLPRVSIGCINADDEPEEIFHLPDFPPKISRRVNKIMFPRRPEDELPAGQKSRALRNILQVPQMAVWQSNLQAGAEREAIRFTQEWQEYRRHNP